MVWVTTAWKMEAATSSGRAPSLRSGCTPVLAKDAAAAGDGINGGGIGREFVEEPLGVGVQQGCHLIDERARAAGAGAVHALLDAVVEIDDLGVLAAQLDGDIGGRDKGSRRRVCWQ